MNSNEQAKRTALIKKRSEQRRKRVGNLFVKGYSYRQIMRALGFKSTAAVTYYLIVQSSEGYEIEVIGNIYKNPEIIQ